MKIRLLSPMVSREVSFLLPRSLLLCGIIYLITLPFFGFCIDIPAGLLLGTLVMTLNFIILGFSSERAVERSIASAKRYMFASYMVRFAITGALFVLCVRSPYLNVVTAAIPTMYPRICYTLDAAVKKRKEGKDL